MAAFMILEAASLYCLYKSSDIHSSWLGHAATEVSAILWKPFDLIGSYIGLKEENLMLAEENHQLYEQLQALQNKKDNDIWLTGGYWFEFLPASIVSRSHNSQHNYVIVNRGWTDGVQEGDGIITSKAVVGIVNSCSANYSMAISFNNAKLSVSAKLGLEGFVGNLSWTGKADNKALLSGIPLHARFEVGDTVYTSGHSSVFPANIPIAIVEGSTVKGGSSAEIDVVMLQDPASLHHVMIVKNNDREEVEELIK